MPVLTSGSAGKVGVLAVVAGVRGVDGGGGDYRQAGCCAERDGPAKGPVQIGRSFRGGFSLPRPSRDRRTVSCIGYLLGCL